MARRAAWAILALLLAAFSGVAPAQTVPQAGSPAPSATPAEMTSDVDPTSPVKAWTFVGTYTGTTYGPGPLVVKQFRGGWSVRSADATCLFDFERGSSVVPLSLGIGKLFTLGTQSVNVVRADSATVIHANAANAPKNTLKLLVRVMYASAYRAR